MLIEINELFKRLSWDSDGETQKKGIDKYMEERIKFSKNFD